MVVSGVHLVQETLEWSNAIGGPGKACSDEWMVRYALTDGGEWVTVATVTGYSEDNLVSFTPVAAQYWSVISTSSPYVGVHMGWSLYAFELIGYDPATEGGGVNCDDHLCLQYIVPTDLTTNPSPAKISDQYADWDPDNLIAPVFEPIWNQGPATQEDASDLHSAIVSRYGVDTSAAVFVEDTTRTSFNDYWGFPYDDSDSVNATQAGVRATAILQTRTLAHYTHSPTVICRASQVHLLRAGMAINIKAAAAISGSHLDEYVTRRIAEVRLRPLSPELGIRRSGTPERLYEAALQLDRPAIKAKLGHGKLQSSATTPHSATELPYTPPGGSPISSTDVQGAIDELQGEIDTLSLDDLDDVNAPSPSDTEVLTWDAGTGRWINAAPSGGGGALDDLSDVTITSVADGDALVYDSGTSEWINTAQFASVEFVINGGGSAITTGMKGTLRVPFAGTITEATILDANGASVSIVVDIKKRAFGGGAAASICAAAKPTLSSDDEATDTTLTGWTTAIAAGDLLYFNVDSAATTTLCMVALKSEENMTVYMIEGFDSITATADLPGWGLPRRAPHLRHYHAPLR